jgi:hypothetical protein
MVDFAQGCFDGRREILRDKEYKRIFVYSGGKSCLARRNILR